MPAPAVGVEEVSLLRHGTEFRPDLLPEPTDLRLQLACR
jgi:hypothetical protein